MKILFLARIGTAFNGEIIYKKSLGGSESALIYLSRELAKLGHEVVIINICPNMEGIFDGVKYINFETLLQTVDYTKKYPFDVIVCFRDAAALPFSFHAKKKILWLHDDYSDIWNAKHKTLGKILAKIIGFIIDHNVDKVFTVSNWLGEICNKEFGIPKEKIYATRNGINLDYFKDSNLQKEPYRCCYTSIPQRGLDVLLNLFPKIKAEIKDAELHIFCGIDRGVLNKKDEEMINKIFANVNQPGVNLRGNLPHKDLAEELLKSSLLLYPSHSIPEVNFFAETSCIAALEAQAAGCPVIASNRGALSETIQNGKSGILINGDPLSKEYQDKFVEEAVKLLKDKERLKQMSEYSKKHIQKNYSWEKIAKEWEQAFAKLLNE